MGLVIDTSVLIAMERGKLHADKFYGYFEDTPLFIAAITASELLHGLERAQDGERKKRRALYIDAILSRIPVINFDLEIARRHAALWVNLELSGNIIGAHDLQIAATALSEGHGVATLNRQEFERVPQLELVDLGPFAQ